VGTLLGIFTPAQLPDSVSMTEVPSIVSTVCEYKAELIVRKTSIETLFSKLKT
jgi:hypothetical protein